jgi:hypothetical protein
MAMGFRNLRRLTVIVIDLLNELCGEPRTPREVGDHVLWAHQSRDRIRYEAAPASPARRTTQPAAWDVDRQFGNTLAQRRVAGAQFLPGHFSALRERLRRKSTPCTSHVCASSSPEAPCGGRAVAGTAGQVPELPSAHEPTSN